MNTDHLRLIERLASEKSLTSAASHMYMSQSALSAVLAKVEEELGYCLFARGRGKRSV